jgi:hypothetical protein
VFITPILVAVCLGGALGTDPSSTAAPVVGPVCNAGGPYFAECQNGVASVTLDGSGSFNPNGAPLQFKWRIECGPATLTNGNTATPTVTLPMNGLCQAQCGRVDLLVRNPEGQISICSTTITFADTQPPVITCPPDLVQSPGDPTDPASTGFASASDACNGAIATSWSDSSSVGPNGETIITRTWSAADACGQSSCDQTITIEEPPPPAGEPDLDMHTTSCPNPVNAGSNGVIPAALSGAAGFDVQDVDLTTLLLSRNDGVGGSIAPKANKFSVADTTTPFPGTLCDCHTLAADGFLDLNMKFDTPATAAALQLGSVPKFTYLQVDLSGQLLDGTPFTVSDCIRVQ